MNSTNQPTDKTPRVAVIIATRDRANDLARCLPTVLANTYPAFEVIVVDQGLGDVPELPHSPLLRYFRHATQGKARALNAACRMTDAPILLFTDDDCTVDSDWVAEGVSLFQREPRVDSIYGALQGIPHDRTIVLIPEFEPPRPRIVSGARRRIFRTHGVGANFAIRAEALQAAGGFDEAFSPGGPYGTGEDTELAYRILRLGRCYMETPAWRATHWGARRFDNGEVRELVVRSYRAFGAIYGRNLRRGDAVAGVAFLVHFAGEARSILDDAIHFRPPIGVRRILGLVTGVKRGFLEARRLPRRGAAVELRSID